MWSPPAGPAVGAGGAAAAQFEPPTWLLAPGFSVFRRRRRSRRPGVSAATGRAAPLCRGAGAFSCIFSVSAKECAAPGISRPEGHTSASQGFLAPRPRHGEAWSCAPQSLGPGRPHVTGRLGRVALLPILSPSFLALHPTAPLVPPPASPPPPPRDQVSASAPDQPAAAGSGLSAAHLGPPGVAPSAEGPETSWAGRRRSAGCPQRRPTPTRAGPLWIPASWGSWGGALGGHLPGGPFRGRPENRLGGGGGSLDRWRSLGLRWAGRPSQCLQAAAPPRWAAWFASFSFLPPFSFPPFSLL